jgi:hypothetical protein
MVDPPATAGFDGEALAALSVRQLLALSRKILAQLRAREVIRSGNAPVGDYAELLVEGEHLQVKARIVTNPRVRGERQLSVFRSWDFDAGVIILFDDEFRVWRAARVAQADLERAGRWVEHVRGWRVMATDTLLDNGEDWTERLRTIAD